MSKTLDLTKPVQTKSGLKVRVICTDAKAKHPVLVLAIRNGIEIVRSYNADGTHSFDSQFDLVNVPVTVRVCLYKHVPSGEQFSLLMTKNSVSEDWMRANYYNVIFKDIVLDT